MAQFLSALFLFFQMLISVFLICLVLIQRGKGGGLAGAFGGQGGSSAFGSKAGDIFTRVTMITAGVWIAFAMLQVVLSNQRGSAWTDTPTPGSASKSTFVDDKNAAPSPKAVAPGAIPPVAPTGPITIPGGPRTPEPVTVPATTPDPLGPGTGPGVGELPSPFQNTPAVPAPSPAAAPKS